MRYTIITIAALICIAAGAGLSQSPSTREQKHTMIATPEGPNISLSADNIWRHETAWDVLQLQGAVEIRTKDMVFRADEASYNQKTGEIEAQGTVRVKLAGQQ